jgi:hypothetical protein
VLKKREELELEAISKAQQRDEVSFINNPYIVSLCDAKD